VLYIGSFIMVYYTFSSLLTDNASAVRVVRIMVGMGAALGVFAAVERLTTFNLFRHLHQFIPVLVDFGGRQTDLLIFRDGGLRVAGSASHPIAFGTMLGTVLPFAMALSFDARDHSERVRWTSAAMLIVVGMLLSGSRTAIMSLALTMAIVAVTRPRHRLLMLTGLAALAFAVHMLFPGVIGSFAQNLQPKTIAQQEVGNREGRLEDWPRIMRHYSAKPLLGRGPGTFTPKKFFFVDNQYLMFLVEIGTLGLLAVLGMFITTFGTLLAAGKRVGGSIGGLIVAAAASTLTYAVTSFTYDSVGFAQPTFMFFATAGIGIALALNAGAFPELDRRAI
jgi:O-antigen ligase